MFGPHGILLNVHGATFHLLHLVASFVVICSCVVGRDPTTTVLNQWPMVMAHDAATTYLRESNGLNRTVLDWTVTQPPVGVIGELNCGARGFDWRPSVRTDGHLVMHHGSVTIDYPMESAIHEILSWCANHTAVEDLVVLGITDCSGNGCVQKVQQLLAKLSVKWISNCSDLKDLTVAAAHTKYALPSGGSLLALFGCWNANYEPSLDCSGFRTVAAEVDQQEPSMYTCYNYSRTKAFPIHKMMNYLDQVGSTAPDPSGKLATAQALWQESTESVIVGALEGSSLLLDEQRSQLNSIVTNKIRSHPWTYVNFLEVNNVCNGGVGLWEALKSLP